MLINVSVCCVLRNVNGIAHSLAKWSLSCNMFGSFDVDFCPPCFVSVIREEAVISVYIFGFAQ